MVRYVVGAFFLFVAIGCFSKAVYDVLRPPPPPTYTARGLADLSAHGEPLPPIVILLTAGFSDEPTPSYRLTVPGAPAVKFDRPTALSPRMLVHVRGRNPVIVTAVGSELR